MLDNASIVYDSKRITFQISIDHWHNNNVTTEAKAMSL